MALKAGLDMQDWLAEHGQTLSTYLACKMAEHYRWEDVQELALQWQARLGCTEPSPGSLRSTLVASFLDKCWDDRHSLKRILDGTPWSEGFSQQDRAHVRCLRVGFRILTVLGGESGILQSFIDADLQNNEEQAADAEAREGLEDGSESSDEWGVRIPADTCDVGYVGILCLLDAVLHASKVMCQLHAILRQTKAGCEIAPRIVTFLVGFDLVSARIKVCLPKEHSWPAPHREFLKKIACLPHTCVCITFADLAQPSAKEKDNIADVVEQVIHVDAAAEISEQEAAWSEQQRHASWIEHAGDAEVFDILESQDRLADPGGVVLLRFGGSSSGGDDTERFRAALLHGPQLRPCRDAMAMEGLSVELPEGTLIFVRPAVYRATLRAFSSHELHPFHVIIAEDLEYLVDEVLASFPRKHRPRSRDRHEHHFEAGSRLEDDDGADEEYVPYPEEEFDEDVAALVSTELCICRTFLHLAPHLRASHTVTQSTTEAVASHGVNPRRVMVV
mmetsp:Transcript_81232/g.196923  ORF Transcript_81232/g.196923 Transcript_81232/m.196923 type:complete len:504 (-) Transcript_81232:69-1580(-)